MAESPFTPEQLQTLPEWSRQVASTFVNSPMYTSVVSEDKKLVTLIAPHRLKAEMIDRLCSIRPGAKADDSEAKHSAIKEIAHLGKLPRGSLPGWHKQKAKLPPCESLLRFVCVHKQLGKALGEDRRKRTHIIENVDCQFKLLVRTLSANEGTSHYLALTMEHGHHVHSCPQDEAHRAPLTAQDVVYLINAYMRYGSAEAVWKEVISQDINAHDAQRLVTPRILAMTQRDIEVFGKKYQLENCVKPGQSDFTELVSIMQALGANGSNVAYKLPGQESSTCTTVAPDVRPLLTKDDIFVFVQSPLQLALLKRYGTCVATDATHCTLSYSKAKLIALHVTSFGEEGVKERGFNVGFVITTSERTEIHKAILLQTMSRAGDDWRPKILMTDIAFAANNAWKDVFPDVKWKWCDFHVWQAWKRKLDHVMRPSEMSKETFRHSIGCITVELLFLIAPKREVTWDEFHRRADNLVKVMFGLGFKDLGKELLVYLGREKYWAPPARREDVDEVIEKGLPLPMLVVSNNSLERFFGVLKWTILKGKAAWTMTSLLRCWIVHHARIKVDVVKCGICIRELLDGASQVDDDELIEEGEDEADIDDARSENGVRVSIDDENHDVLPDESERDEMDVEQISLETATTTPFTSSSHDVNFRTNDELTRVLDKTVAQLHALKIHIRDQPMGFVPERRNLTKVLSRTANIVDTAMGLTPSFEADSLGALVLGPFRKQRENYGAPDLIVTQEVVEAAKRTLYKGPRQQASKDPSANDKDEDEDFDALSARLLKDAEFIRRIDVNMLEARSESFPSIRANLERNKNARLFAIASLVVKADVRKNDKKQILVESIIGAIIRMLPTTWKGSNPDIDSEIADVGRAVSDKGHVRANEIILLRANGIDSRGVPCTSACDVLLGWVVRNAQLVGVGAELNNLKWGRLHEREQNVMDLTA